MRRKISLILIALCMLSACFKKESVEEFKKDYFINFADVKNPVLYMDIQNPTLLSESNNELIFAVSQKNDIDFHDKDIHSIYNYIRDMEDIGYQLDLLDGTTQQSFILNNEKYTITILIYTDNQYLIQANTDLLNIKDVKTENVLYKLTKKDV